MTTRNWNTNLKHLRGLKAADMLELLLEAARNGETLTLTVDDERRAMAYSLIKREASEGREMSYPEAYKAVGVAIDALEDKGPDAVGNRMTARMNTKGGKTECPKGSWTYRTKPNSKGKKSKTVEMALTLNGLAHYGITPRKGQIIGFSRTNQVFGEPYYFKG